MSYVTRKMPNEMPWYAWFSLAVLIPASFFGSAWLMHWATGADPLVEEIWRLRGQNSVLRERLEQLEGDRLRDADTLRKVIDRK
jgi:hypothetical protein